MKLRYYLRGLGTGILVTALILGRLIGMGRPLTDAEIRAKALTLGMVDANSVNLSNVGGDRNEFQLTPIEDFMTNSPEPEKTPEQGKDPSPSPEEGVETSATPEAMDNTVTQSPSSEDVVSFEILDGESSYTVSVRLADAGLVEDAREFDNYLVDNGYSRSIRAGTYMIPVGASWEEIAEMIS